ncbi:Gfo/Idh/MocA family oxidoreductase [Bradyrhizobium prioriisuperbiae]|uniref:Gfo/Idh/MocA family protein n=1 Tax=Bradyrhizobium prioriisuperbiae TaxID=2854389 RepID=UPI0028EE097B|nr:Gfo/Idh/MocA family oxidoreductase [Bradyrhizobium prioritasuperba]
MASARIGIIGLGTIGKAHWKVIRESSQTTLIAVADPTPSALDFARSEDIPAYADYCEMLENETLDGVIVAVPNAQHVPVALACIERNIAVLVEKPVADSVEDARVMCKAAEARDVPLLVGHHRRHNAAIQRVRRGIHDGLIGRPVTATVMYNQLKTASYFDLDWRRQVGGGPILINLIHEIDLIRFMFGEIHSLQAVSSNAVRGFAVEDTAAVLLRFHSGAIGTISVSDTAVSPFSWDLTSGEFDLMLETSDRMKRQKVSTHVFSGTEGSLTLPTLQHYHYRGVAEPGWRSDLNAEVLAAESADTYLRQVEHFARVIRREEAPLVSGKDGVRTLQATLAVKEAAATGQTIMLSE